MFSTEALATFFKHGGQGTAKQLAMLFDTDVRNIQNSIFLIRGQMDIGLNGKRRGTYYFRSSTPVRVVNQSISKGKTKHPDLSIKLKQFFESGKTETNVGLAKLLGTSDDSIRCLIHRLRTYHQVPIETYVPPGEKISYYRLNPNIKFIPKIGRPEV